MTRPGIDVPVERVRLAERLLAAAAGLVGVPAPRLRLVATKGDGKARGWRRLMVKLDRQVVATAPAEVLAELIGHEVGHFAVPGWQRATVRYAPAGSALAMVAAVAAAYARTGRSLTTVPPVAAVVAVMLGTAAMLAVMTVCGHVLQGHERDADGLARWLVGPAVFEASLQWGRDRHPDWAGTTRWGDPHLRPADRASLARGPEAVDPGPLLQALAS